MLDKSVAQKILSLEGRAKGVVFQTDLSYILKKWGEDGLKKIEGQLKELGCPIDYRQIRAMEWLPMGARILSLMVVKDGFQLGDEDIKGMGRNAPKVSFLLRFLLRTVVSPAATLEHTRQLWKNHYTRGKVFAEYREEEKIGRAHV